MATSTIKRPNLFSPGYAVAVATIVSEANYVYIMNGAITFYKRRNPILCVYTTQSGGMNIFVIFSGQNGTDWNLAITNIVGTSTLTATIDGDNIKISGIGSWGTGYAIGLAN
jgi:hypothetical protein